jgi:Bacteriocin-protection, YdeI or OmpD-Associated/Domain of unknown function (DUF1905)
VRYLRGEVPAKTFTVELQRVQKTATMFRVPFDLGEAFGRARPPVKVTIRNHTWRTTPGVYDGVGYIVVNRAVKAATGVDAGDRVRVRMERDTEPRKVRLPADLRKALARAPEAKAAFAKLSFTHQREYLEWVEEAKRPETRLHRIAATVDRVVSGEPRR